MDKQNGKLYFPLFYKYSSILSALSAEELGTLIRAILLSEGNMPSVEALDCKLDVIFKLLISDAQRLYERNLTRTAGKNNKRKPEPTKLRYGDFDPTEEMKKALRRTYGDAYDIDAILEG